jgi:hypothetical protein
MEVVSCKKDKTIGKKYGYVIKHNQPNGWMGTTGNYIGWYRYKKDAIERLDFYKKTLNIN